MMEKRQVSLQDKYILEEGRAFMTGIQALVRLPMVQRRLDQSKGLGHRRLYQRLQGISFGSTRSTVGPQPEVAGRTPCPFQPRGQ